jgi:hypothetical protein
MPHVRRVALIYDARSAYDVKVMTGVASYRRYHKSKLCRGCRLGVTGTKIAGPMSQVVCHFWDVSHGFIRIAGPFTLLEVGMWNQPHAPYQTLESRIRQLGMFGAVLLGGILQ